MIEIILLILLSGTLSYFVYRAYILAGTVADQEEYIQELEDMSQYMYDQIEESYNQMKRIDHKGSFAEDDEAGTTFTLLKDVVINLEKEFNAETEEKK
jgi:hypothetical protein|tara:strand:+ start:263 stop:556 length:294 start_codon:yes stop_codon:yes gene_type:complete